MDGLFAPIMGGSKTNTGRAMFIRERGAAAICVKGKSGRSDYRKSIVMSSGIAIALHYNIAMLVLITSQNGQISCRASADGLCPSLLNFM